VVPTRPTIPGSAAGRSCGELGRSPKRSSARSALPAACGSSSRVVAGPSGPPRWPPKAQRSSAWTSLTGSCGRPEPGCRTSRSSTRPPRVCPSDPRASIWCSPTPGALSWSDPTYTIPGADRVLVPGGRLVFNTTSPWLRVCYDDCSDRIIADVHRSYSTSESSTKATAARTYTVTYGAWIRTFRANGLVVEDLPEPHPAPRRVFEPLHLRPDRLGRSLARRNPLGDPQDRVTATRCRPASRRFGRGLGSWRAERYGRSQLRAASSASPGGTGRRRG
jgi:hypothetical protein